MRFAVTIKMAYATMNIFNKSPLLFLLSVYDSTVQLVLDLYMKILLPLNCPALKKASIPSGLTPALV